MPTDGGNLILTKEEKKTYLKNNQIAKNGLKN